MAPRQGITPDDWRQIAELLADAAAAETLYDMVETVIRHAHDLFPAELVICDRFDQHARQLAFQMYPMLDDTFHQQMVPAFIAHWHQHPYQPRWTEEIGGGRIGFLSDRVTQREFRRTGLWNEVYVHLRAKNQILLGGPIQTNTYWCLSLNRLGRDYGAREREICAFLQPRLTRIFQRQARRETAGRTAEILSHPAAATLLVDNKGYVQEASERARALLECTPRVSGQGTVIAALAASGDSAASAATVQTLSIDGIPAVVFRPAPNSPAFVMLEQRRAPAATGASKLTSREAEILHWIGEGKTNAEIGLLLGISPRTVGKHCEQLFAKLGVENRFGAALRSRQLT